MKFVTDSEAKEDEEGEVDREPKEAVAEDEAAALLVALGIMALVIIVVVSAALASQ